MVHLGVNGGLAEEVSKLSRGEGSYLKGNDLFVWLRGFLAGRETWNTGCLSIACNQKRTPLENYKRGLTWFSSRSGGRLEKIEGHFKSAFAPRIAATTAQSLWVVLGKGFWELGLSAWVEKRNQ